MYTRVPDALKEPILAEIKRSRIRSSLKYFPIVVLFFAAIAFLVLIVHGHGFIENIRDDLPAGISKTVAYIIIFLGIAVAMTPVAIIILIKICREAHIQNCRYCAKCDAVDSFDSGTCPYCKSPINESAEFIFTDYKDELKLLKRHGLQPSRDIQLTEHPDSP